jgi:hypothetical protein
MGNWGNGLLAKASLFHYSRNAQNEKAFEMVLYFNEL